MGVDLTLLPLIAEDFWAAHDLLRVERRRELWPSITALPTLPIPEPLSCYVAQLENGECGYGRLAKDPYGSLLEYTTAGALLTLASHESVNDCWENRAVWAYLAQMPSEWKIVLYWH